MTEQNHETANDAAQDPMAGDASAAVDAAADAAMTVANDLALRNVCEAALLAAGRPLTVEQIAELFDEAERPGSQQVRMALEALSLDYATRGIELREVSTGFRVQVRAESASVVSRLWQERPAKYSRALLETLALIAYRQPITRGEIEDIRGVAVNPNIIRTLQERGWIRTVGYREVPGRPELLGTTREFLDYFGLKSLDNLPTLAQLRDVENLGVQLEFPETQPAVAAADALAADALAAEAAADEPTEAVPVAEEGVPDEPSIDEPAVDETAREDAAAADGAADDAADDTTSAEPN
jgi:segregation and condensation protein B